MLSNSYLCVALKITNLQDENKRLGRSTGNQMMKMFARVLTSVFTPSKNVFVAYNDAGQYLIFADDFNPERAEASLAQVRTVLAQKCENEVYDIEYSEGWACSGAEQSFYIRKLLSIALRRLGEAQRNPQKKDVEPVEPEEPKPAVLPEAAADADGKTEAKK